METQSKKNRVAGSVKFERGKVVEKIQPELTPQPLEDGGVHFFTDTRINSTPILKPCIGSTPILKPCIVSTVIPEPCTGSATILEFPYTSSLLASDVDFTTTFKLLHPSYSLPVRINSTTILEPLPLGIQRSAQAEKCRDLGKNRGANGEKNNVNWSAKTALYNIITCQESENRCKALWYIALSPVFQVTDLLLLVTNLLLLVTLALLFYTPLDAIYAKMLRFQAKFKASVSKWYKKKVIHILSTLLKAANLEQIQTI